MEERVKKLKKEEKEVIKKYGENARRVLDIIKKEKREKEDKGE